MSVKVRGAPTSLADAVGTTEAIKSVFREEGRCV